MADEDVQAIRRELAAVRELAQKTDTRMGAHEEVCDQVRKSFGHALDAIEKRFDKTEEAIGRTEKNISLFTSTYQDGHRDVVELVRSQATDMNARVSQGNRLIVDSLNQNVKGLFDTAMAAIDKLHATHTAFMNNQAVVNQQNGDSIAKAHDRQFNAVISVLGVFALYALWTTAKYVLHILP